MRLRLEVARQSERYDKDRKKFALIGIVLISHGLLAEGMKDAVEMIIGPQEFFRTIGMQAETELSAVRKELEAAVQGVSCAGGVLVLVDILGGSPANASAQLALQGTTVLCGVNLPMLLELLIQREHCSLRDLSMLALQAAKEGVINLTQQVTQND